MRLQLRLAILCCLGGDGELLLGPGANKRYKSQWLRDGSENWFGNGPCRPCGPTCSAALHALRTLAAAAPTCPPEAEPLRPPTGV